MFKWPSWIFDAEQWLTVIVLSAGFLLSGCQKDLPDNQQTMRFYKPDHFPEPTYPLHTNPITNQGFELGKRLFNEPLLSVDNSVACSNCHAKGVAFSDPQHNPSLGIFERSGTRNAPALSNLAFKREFFWDGSVSQLDFVPLAAIENEKEMGETLGNVVKKLNRHTQYPTLFREAFVELDTITGPYLLKALSQYLLMFISDDSDYDRYLAGKGNLSESALKGEELFKANCQSCHSGALFTNEEFKNNGLDDSFKDFGREGITEGVGDRGKFIVPSLRNIQLSAPYMHDGRFQTLRKVLDFYDENVKLSSTLADELQDGSQLGIPLTEDEKDDLEAFLMTLTDYSFIHNSNL